VPSSSEWNYEEAGDSVVDIAGHYGVRISEGARDFMFLKTVQTGYGAQPASYSSGNGIISQALTRPEREVDHSPPYSAEVKNEWGYTSTSSICLHEVKNNNSTFCL
jgi:hypothetical protein